MAASVHARPIYPPLSPHTPSLQPCGVLRIASPHCSEVYCYGPLLETVQGADLYNDSKTFVDKPMRFDPAEVLNAFSLSNLTANSTKDEVRAFVERYFLETGSELLQWTPSDWTERLCWV